MRLDARKGDSNWQCYDVERGTIVTPVVWVDEASATWGAPDTTPGAFLLGAIFGELITKTHYEKCIKVCLDGRIVLFNPLDDVGEIETVQEVIASIAPPLREHVR